MQKTTDRLIKEQLEKETGESLGENLKRSILSSFERKATQETFRNLMEDKFRNIARVEVFKKDEYPGFTGVEGTAEEKNFYNKLVKILERAEKGMKSVLGDNFIGISLCGSWAKGYANGKSDIDLYLLVKNKDAEVDDALAAISYGIGKRFRREVAVNPFCTEEINGLVRKVDSNWEKNDDAAKAAIKIAAFFEGKVFGDNSKIKFARKEIIEELVKNPYGDVVWDGVRVIHYIGIVGLAKGLNQTTAETVAMRLKVSVEDLREIVKARKEFSLPTLEEMKKRYGVA